MWENYTNKFKAWKLVAFPVAMTGSVASLMSIAFSGDVSSNVKTGAIGASVLAVLVTGTVGFLKLVADAKQRQARAQRDADLIGRLEGSRRATHATTCSLSKKHSLAGRGRPAKQLLPLSSAMRSQTITFL